MYCHGLSLGRIILILPAPAWECTRMGQYTCVWCSIFVLPSLLGPAQAESLLQRQSSPELPAASHQFPHLFAEWSRAWLVAILVVALALPVGHSRAILFSAVLPAVLGICRHCWMRGGGAGAICPGSYSWSTSHLCPHSLLWEMLS